MSLPLAEASEAQARIEALAETHGDLDTQALLQVLIDREFPKKIALVSSFGAESAILLHMVAAIDQTVPVLFLDTGFLFNETHAYREKLTADLGLTDVRVLTPEPSHEHDFDPDRALHASHPEVCCFLRKVAPLRKALSGFDAWISGRKRYHGGSRTNLDEYERDGRHIKVNPLAGWDHGDIEAYRLAHDLALHPLVAEGYESIGCWPCTSRVDDGEDARAGRWRGRDKSECGIHFVDGRPVRADQRP